MDKNSLKYSYFDIKTISELTGVSPRTLKDRCVKNKYQTRKIHASGGKSGLKYEILFSSLEYELQNKILINSIHVNANLGESTTNCLQNPPISLRLNFTNTNSIQTSADCADNSVQSAFFEDFNYKSIGGNYPATSLGYYPAAVNSHDYANNTINDSHFSLSKINAETNSALIPDSAKKIALAKYDLVEDWQNFRNNNKNKKQADSDYIKAYNNNLVAQELFQIIGKISKRSLYRWQKSLKDNDNNYLALINGYNYTGESQLTSTLSDLEKQEFTRLYYNDAKLNIATAYQLLKIKFKKQGLEIKSLATFRRFVDFIRRNHKDFEILARHGEKALKDSVAPFNRRDKSDIKPGEILVADGNKLDFMVKNPYTGKSARAIWVVFFDWGSFDVAGYEIMLTENTQNISSALRNAILRLGKIPKKVYMDNGRAFRGTYFKGCDDFNHCGFKGIYKNLGIEEVVAKPYNGRSKIVERFFGDFVRCCPPLISSYTGSSIANKPAHLMRNEKFHKELHKNDKVPTIEQAKLIIETWLNEFHRIKPCPFDKTKTIGEMFELGKGQGINVDMLDELMMSECIRSAKRNTIKLFGLEYECAELYGLEDKFVIKYSLFDISKIKIYSLKGEFVGIAHTVEPVKAFAKDGSAIDLYNYRMQQKQHAKMLKGTVEKTKTFIGANPFDDISFAKIKQQEVTSIEEKRQKKKLEITLYEDVKQDFQKKIKFNV